jgi:hypothetical protein
MGVRFKVARDGIGAYRVGRVARDSRDRSWGDYDGKAAARRIELELPRPPLRFSRGMASGYHEMRYEERGQIIAKIASHLA